MAKKLNVVWEAPPRKKVQIPTAPRINISAPAIRNIEVKAAEILMPHKVP